HDPTWVMTICIVPRLAFSGHAAATGRLPGFRGHIAVASYGLRLVAGDIAFQYRCGAASKWPLVFGWRVSTAQPRRCPPESGKGRTGVCTARGDRRSLRWGSIAALSKKFAQNKTAIKRLCAPPGQKMKKGLIQSPGSARVEND